MSIIKFIKNNIDNINEEFQINKSKDFKFVYKKPNEVLNFIFKGSGTYGNVFQVTNNTNEVSVIPKGESLVLKIMKRKNLNELDKTKEIHKVINSSKNKYIIHKYIMNIHNVDMDNDLIFLEYLSGNTLDNYLNDTSITENELNIFFLKALLSIKVFHNILKYSHRDIKLQNIVYNPETGIMKCIDYGFISKLKDKKCKNKYQGTGKYTHPDMNKKYSTQKYNNTISFPDSISQDFFSTIILLFKIYIIYEKKKQKGGSMEKQNKPFMNKQSKNISSNIFLTTNNNRRKTRRNMNMNMNMNMNTGRNMNTGMNIGRNILKNKNNNLLNLLNQYDKSFKHKRERNNMKQQRFISKNKLLHSLVKLDENTIDNVVIREVIKLIKKYWDLKKNNFCINKKKNILITNFIFDTLVFNIFNVIPDSEEKKKLLFDWSIIYTYNLNI